MRWDLPGMRSFSLPLCLSSIAGTRSGACACIERAFCPGARAQMRGGHALCGRGRFTPFLELHEPPDSCLETLMQLNN